MLQLCHMKKFAITSAEQLTPGMYNTRGWGYKSIENRSRFAAPTL
jgi:hypothetical protein